MTTVLIDGSLGKQTLPMRKMRIENLRKEEEVEELSASVVKQRESRISCGGALVAVDGVCNDGSVRGSGGASGGGGGSDRNKEQMTNQSFQSSRGY